MTTTGSPKRVVEAIELDPARRRRAILGGTIGSIIEYYDFTIYAFLAVILAKVFFPSEDATVALLSTFAVFAVPFVLRPVGGIIIGHLADRFGRRRALTICVGAMMSASFVFGLIPGVASIGVSATVLIVVMRCIQGLSAGGELGTAASYVAEESPDNKRGFLTGFVNFGTVAGTLLGSLTVAVVELFVSEPDMVAWGWRIPFLLSLPLGIVALIIRRRMAESVAFEAVVTTNEVKRAPLIAVLKARPGGVLLILALGLTSNACYWIVFTYMSTYLQTQKILAPTAATWTTSATLILAGLSIPLWSRLSDRVGRKPVMIGTNVAFLVLTYPLFLLASQGPVFAIVAQIVLGQITACYLANLLATLTEILPTSLRVSGFAFGYNVASILAGGSASYIAVWLVATTGIAASPAFFIMAATFFALIGSIAMRETANRPLPLDDEPQPA
jgi:MHS family proline/betaine transporter-like MFS transporter